MKYLLALTFLFNSIILIAQTDKPAIEDSEIDTVVVVKDPVYVIKRVKLTASPTKKWAVELQGSASTHFAYYDVCESCKGLFDTIRQSTSKRPGLRVGVGIQHYGKRFMQQLSLGYQQYSESFSYEGASSKNKLQYLNVGLEMGIRILSAANFTSHLTGAVEWQSNYRVSGKTLSEDKTYQLVSLAETRSYRKNMWAVGGGIRNMVSLGSRAAVSLSLLYRFDLQSNTGRAEPFLEQRNHVHGLVGLMYFLN